MKANFHFRYLFVLLFLLLYSAPLLSQTNAEIIRTIHYTEIINAQITPFAGVERMKISANGEKVVFNTVGGKLYSINSDGTDFTVLLEENGRGFIDISADGSTIIFARLYGGKIFVFNSSGGSPIEIADALPLPGGGYTGPDIRLSPVIADSSTETGSTKKVYFTAVAGGPDVAGVYKCNIDGSDLEQIFNYRYMSQSLFGMNGDEFNLNVAFRLGFDVSENGKNLAVGTINFQAEGHTIFWSEANGLQILKDFGPVAASLEQGITINNSGSIMVMTKPIPALGGALIAVNTGTGSEIELIENIGTSPIIQLTADGDKLLAKGDSYPLLLVNTDGSGILHILNSLSIGGTNDPFYRNSIGPTISITSDGNRFAVVSALNYNDYSRIWINDILPGGTATTPYISNIQFNPNTLVVSAGNVSTFTASISGGTILKAGFSGFKDGVFKHIIGNGNAYILYDNGTNGDILANDGIYTSGGVWAWLTQNPDTSEIFTIRFSAYSEHNVTVADAEPLFIYNNPVSVERNNKQIPDKFSLEQNYPNPFNPTTTIKFAIPVVTENFASIQLKIYDILGREVATLVNEEMQPGVYTVKYDAINLSSGIYFYQLKAGKFVSTKKMILLR